jgi:hypothetical protein
MIYPKVFLFYFLKNGIFLLIKRKIKLRILHFFISCIISTSAYIGAKSIPLIIYEAMESFS